MQLICTVMQADVVPQTQGVHQRSEFRLNCHIVVFPAQHGLYVVDIFADLRKRWWAHACKLRL